MDSITNNEINPNNSKELDNIPRSSGVTELHRIISAQIPISEGATMGYQKQHKRRFLDFPKAYLSKEWFLKSGRLSPFAFLRRKTSQRGENGDDRLPSFRVPFVRKIKWLDLMKYFKNWTKHPANMALLVWIFFVAVGLIILFLLTTGLLNGAIPKSSTRKKWTEITNQILNALFTILCIYQYPRLFHHLVLLLRWRTSDAIELRKTYCKGKAARPRERAHLFLVVSLFHITCFSQFGLCALYWGFSSNNRPNWGEIIFVVVGTCAPVIAFFYIIYSPLGRKHDTEIDDESHTAQSEMIEEQTKQEKQQLRRSVTVTTPEWVGGLFNCYNDMTVAFMSLFCMFCVFGWNMERLGLGNMYVHIFTFMLLCIAPFWVFNVAGLKISDVTIRYIVGVSGVVLCFLGLLYGGFWRTQIRKRFKLPANSFCCGYPAMTDFMQWLFCCSCSLAQEVRTVNFYDMEDGSFYKREAASPPEALAEAVVPLGSAQINRSMQGFV